MSGATTVPIVASFEIQADQLAAVLRHLKLRGAMASSGFDTLTPSDVLAFQVLLASGQLRSDGTSALDEVQP